MNAIDCYLHVTKINCNTIPSTVQHHCFAWRYLGISFIVISTVNKLFSIKQVIKNNEMNSYMYVGMTMVKKEQGQKDDYSSQQSIILTLPASISLLTISSTYMYVVFWQSVALTCILSLIFFNHCHSYIAVHFIEMFLLLVYFLQFILYQSLHLLQAIQLWQLHWGWLSQALTAPLCGATCHYRYHVYVCC